MACVTAVHILLAARAFPNIIFESTHVYKISDTEGTVQGNITFLGVTKPITLNVIFHKAGVNQYTQKQVVGFTGETKLKRSDFGMNHLIPAVGDAVSIRIHIEFERDMSSKQTLHELRAESVITHRDS